MKKKKKVDNSDKVFNRLVSKRPKRPKRPRRWYHTLDCIQELDIDDLNGMQFL